MFLKIKKVTSRYTRASKTGIKHSYLRTKTVAVFSCDSCSIVFEREIGNMDHRRLSNNYSHVCSNCNPKQFAQRKGVESRRFWNMPVDQDIEISKF
jgi:hypothetical protein